MENKNPIVLLFLLLLFFFVASCGDKKQENLPNKVPRYKEYNELIYDKEFFLVTLFTALGVQYDIEVIEVLTLEPEPPDTIVSEDDSYGFIIQIPSMRSIEKVDISAVRTAHMYKECWRFTPKGSNKMYSMIFSREGQNDKELISGYLINKKDTIELLESDLNYPLRLLHENGISLDRKE